MLEASCHCGAVRIRAEVEPEWISDCNCSICRRLGARWMYFHPSQVSFVRGAGTTVAYLHGDRTLEMHHCPICGCTTHWESARKEGAERMAVNARLVDPQRLPAFACAISTERRAFVILIEAANIETPFVIDPPGA